MAQTMDIYDDLRRRIVDAHWVGKGYKIILKCLDFTNQLSSRLCTNREHSTPLLTLPTTIAPTAIHVGQHEIDK